VQSSSQPTYTSSNNQATYSSSNSATTSFNSPIMDPVISSTLDQIVDTLSAYQSTQPGYSGGTRRRRKNEFVASPKFNPEVLDEEEFVSPPQRIRAILAILENRRVDNSQESFVSKRDIMDALESIDEDLVNEETKLENEILIEKFFRKR